MSMGTGVKNYFTVRCHDPNGAEVWTESFGNRVPTEGLNHLLTNELKGVAYTASWFVGLIDNANFGSLQATDTAAKITTSAPSGGTNQWQESLVYTQTVRQTLTLGAVASGSVDNSAALATYSIGGTATLNGAFIVSSNGRGGTSGTLYGEGSFSSTHPVMSGQTITIQVTCTASSL